MNKKIRHMGMTMTEEEHETWHKEHLEITPEQHKALMREMGISKEEDDAWHKTHRTRQEKPEKKAINPFAVGKGFLDYCVKQKWLVQEGTGRSLKYYLTKEGHEEIKNFGIKL